MNSDSANTSDAFASRCLASSDSNPSTQRNRAWIWVCLLLIVVTWAPVFGIHIYRMSLNAENTGTVVVVFSPTLTRRDLFRNVMGANGSLVRPVRWFPSMWVVRSLEPGFVGRLKIRGAWGVYSIDFLSANAIFNCMRIVVSTGSSDPVKEVSAPPAS